MPVITSDKTQPTYDVIVVGSGAVGGQTACTLTLAGVNVLMLESGRKYDPVKETPRFQHNGEAPLRAAGTPEKPMGFYDSTVDGGWAVPAEPYTNASSDPARQFMGWRARMLGGRTNHCGRISLRNGRYNFNPHRRDGLGFDWTIGDEDAARYYGKVEMPVGVYGSNEGLENTPNSSPGVLLPPPRSACRPSSTKGSAGRIPATPKIAPSSWPDSRGSAPSHSAAAKPTSRVSSFVKKMPSAKTSASSPGRSRNSKSPRNF